jgi:RHS repeat-associated protein
VGVFVFDQDRTSRRGGNAGDLPRSTAATENREDAPGKRNSTQSEQQKRPSDLLPSVSLPKGGGAIRGIGEKFSVNAATGTSAMVVPLPFSPGRSGFTPSLQLSYDSSSGNGIFGFGWSLGVPTITRKTDKGLPRYCDADESDVYILAGAEDLVPILDPNGARKTTFRTVYGTPYRIAFYRPRIEGLFARIERWLDVRTGITHWRSLSRDNVTTLYGYDATCRIADPRDATKVFAWQICRSWDDKGNVALYAYVHEDGAGINTAQAHEANRSARGNQTYLKAIQYGNLQPYFPDWTAEAELALPSDWMFSVVLDYGDHTASPPTPQSDGRWTVRPDPFSSYRAGYEIRTYRRVRRVLFFNNFPQEQTAGVKCLVRSIDLVFSDERAPTDPHNPIYTFVVSLTQSSYRSDNANAVSRSMPPLEFTYSQPVIQSSILSLDRDSLGNLPEGIDGSRFRWIDLDGEGLSGILSEATTGWYYKRNLSANNLVKQSDGTRAARASFGALETVAALPSRSDFDNGALKLLDLAGNGQLDVVELAEPDPGFFKRTTDGDFEPFKRFASRPQLDWSDSNVKFIDVTGDGLADVLMTEDGLYTFYTSLGEAGFDKALQVRTPWDEERGPKVVLADGTETIFVADMSGDGLNDIVRVRNGETCYWPNIGYGRFGAKVTMDLAPRFDNEERFDPLRIRLADIDGSGAADLLYVGEDGVRVWFNQSGNTFSAPTSIAVFPTADKLSSVQVIDLLGTGTACLVWSSPLPAEAAAPLLYVDLMGGNKPHLMVMSRNNLGAETRVTYAPSTRFYLRDKEAGRPWVTRLTFPVQVVERTETIDWVGRNRLVVRYAYHHGYYDGYEREFRGFGMVEQWDTEEFREDTNFNDGDFVNWAEQSWSPPMRTRTWFHTGAFQQAQSVTQQYNSEYWIEPALLTAGRAADAAAMRPPDTLIPDNLNPFEIQEAYRALKGKALRTEISARDGSPNADKRDNPYTVTEENFTIMCLQKMGTNLHAVFFVCAREAISFQYEHGADDPRVSHEFTLETDNYGNVKRSVSIGYPRRNGYPPPEPTLSSVTQAMLAYDQTRLHMRATEQQYTNAIDDLTRWPDSYRVPLVSATNSAEILGVAPSVKGTGITNLFSFAELDGTAGSDGIWQSAWSGTADMPYEAIPAADVDGAGVPASTLTRRFVRQSRTLYRSDDLSILLPLGQLQIRALVGQSYTAALTPGLLSGIFDTSVTAATLTEGGYITLLGENGWWIPSARIFYSPGDSDTPAQELSNALIQFFMPRRAVDPFGAIARVDYDRYSLLPIAITDPVKNVTRAGNDYRVLAPSLVVDPNGNRGAVAYDVLGLLSGTAVMGKASETLGDLLTGFTLDLDEPSTVAQFTNPLSDPGTLLGKATTRILYDINAYLRTARAAQPSPAAVYTLARETHVSDLGQPNGSAETQYQFGFVYSDGFGREIQRKARAAPGPLTADGGQVSPRWAGSGWTIFNNKGKPVRRYEPFFSATNSFEFAAQTGVSTVLLYDPPGRVIATLHPDNTWEKIVFDAWRQETWDGNDTVRITDPRTDPDVGGNFERALGAAATFTSWYNLRIGGAHGATAEAQAAQKDAAQKTAAHEGTPAVTHFDALGRTCLAVTNDGGGSRYPVRTAIDTEGKPLAVFDARGQRAQEYVYRTGSAGGSAYLAGVDMAGNPLYHINADGGARRGLNNVAGNPIRNLDARGHAFRLVYDPAQRPKQRYVSTNGATEILIDLSIYGEGLEPENLAGRLFRHYDMAGFMENSQYDYNGNLTSSVRQLALRYQETIDWSPLANLTSATDLDNAATTSGLLPLGDGGRDRFTGSTVYDALNRPIQTVTPHNATMKPGVIRPVYDQGAQLVNVDVWLQQSAVPTGLIDPGTADRHAVTGIQYNARRQRLSIAFGNGTLCSYEYDPQTFRLTSLTSLRPSSFAANERTVQALSYFYDPVGNITRIRDDADTQDVIYFQNQRVEPSADYTYDPLYRLIASVGREHLGQNGGVLQAPQQITADDSFRTGLLQPWDGKAMGVYTETYTYDPVDNLVTMSHQVSSGNWTRRYSCAEVSQIVASETGNRLSATSLPGDPAAGPFRATYAYDPHGNMIRMPHLPAISWDEDDRLRSSTRQVVNTGTPGTTFYVYDAGGQRVRKLTAGQAAVGQTTKLTAERIYLGAIEVYREFAADGTTVSLERETLHLNAAEQPIALVETRTTGSDKAPKQLVRYQFSNHLSSAILELGDQSDIISYEEYLPFGSTSYQAVANQVDAPKRCRYTGKERDEESDLYYHGARYYAPWVGRWTACDPIGIGDGLNVCAYAANNPVRLVDPSGRQNVQPKAAPGPPTFSIDRIEKQDADLERTEALMKQTAEMRQQGWIVGQPDKVPPALLGTNYKDIYNATMAQPIKDRTPVGPAPAIIGTVLRTVGEVARLPETAAKALGVGDLVQPFYDMAPLGILGELGEAASAATQLRMALPEFLADTRGSLLFETKPLSLSEPAGAMGEAHSPGRFAQYMEELARQEHANPGDPLRAPVLFSAPPAANAMEEAHTLEAISLANLAHDEGLLSVVGRVSTQGALGSAKSAAAGVERARALEAGTPYKYVVGHGPDATWTGKAATRFWQDVLSRVNSSLGGQARRYPLGYRPTRFLYSAE